MNRALRGVEAVGVTKDGMKMKQAFKYMLGGAIVGIVMYLLDDIHEALK